MGCKAGTMVVSTNKPCPRPPSSRPPSSPPLYCAQLFFACRRNGREDAQEKRKGRKQQQRQRLTVRIDNSQYAGFLSHFQLPNLALAGTRKEGKPNKDNDKGGPGELTKARTRGRKTTQDFFHSVMQLWEGFGEKYGGGIEGERELRKKGRWRGGMQKINTRMQM